MIKGIDHRIEESLGHSLNLMKIGKVYAWFVDIEGQRYGDWIEKATTDESEETYEVMRSHYKLTLEELNK